VRRPASEQFCSSDLSPVEPTASSAGWGPPADSGGVGKHRNRSLSDVRTLCASIAAEFARSVSNNREICIGIPKGLQEVLLPPVSDLLCPSDKTETPVRRLRRRCRSKSYPGSCRDRLWTAERSTQRNSVLLHGPSDSLAAVEERADRIKATHFANTA
jgi:hypothetical protein